MKDLNRICIILLIAMQLVSCYSFKGISIPPDVSTFFVANLETRSTAVPVSFPAQFAENLKNKIRNESRLVYKDVDPDISFAGTITDYRISPVAPKPGETASINRLDVSIEIQFTNAKNDKENWKQTFKHFADFSANQNLLDVQDKLLVTISDQLLEDIFNRAFTNW